MRKLLVKYKSNATSEEIEKLDGYINRIGCAGGGNDPNSREVEIYEHVQMDTNTIKKRLKAICNNIVVEVLSME